MVHDHMASLPIHQWSLAGDGLLAHSAPLVRGLWAEEIPGDLLTCLQAFGLHCCISGSAYAKKVAFGYETFGHYCVEIIESYILNMLIALTNQISAMQSPCPPPHARLSSSLRLRDAARHIASPNQPRPAQQTPWQRNNTNHSNIFKTLSTARGCCTSML